MMPDPTSTYLEAILQPWLDENLALVSATNPISDHIDRLLGEKPSPAQMVTISMRAFCTLITLLERLRMPVRPAMFIPLISHSATLTLTPPRSLNEIAAQLSDEPPGLYLLSWEHNRASWPEEIYSVPLTFPLLPDLPSGILTTYQEARHGQDITDGEEFSHALRVDYFPLGVHP